MPSSVLILGDLRGGKLRLDNLHSLTQWIQEQADGARFRALFELTDLTRRARQETFYRRVLLPHLAEHVGNDLKAQHQDCWLVLTAQTEIRLASAIDIAKDLASLTDEQLSRYVHDAVRLAAELGCVLPERP